MTSGLIYAVIIAMWGAYFIPMWLRRHEERSESRSVERFSRAMRILSRRPSTPDQRYVVMPPRPTQPARADGIDSADSADSDAPTGTTRPRRPSRRATPLVVRRRRILAALVLATALAAVLAPLTPVPWWAPAGLLAAVGADLVHLRVQARRLREVSRHRESLRARTLARLRRVDSAERIAASRRTVAEERAAADEARRIEDAAAAAAARAEAEGWSPVPVPLPTYVTKPMAPPAANHPAPATASPGAKAVADDLDAIIDRRRAVND